MPATRAIDIISWPVDLALQCRTIDCSRFGRRRGWVGPLCDHGCDCLCLSP
ncbi:MAG: hypothetical protein NTV57_06735 [Cyanobacteria bacterium]|nr:hypothetical protein [Cyanobacteriota bacterium]